jgi:hypothetical protein
MKKLFATSFILLNSVLAIYAQWNGTNPLYTTSEVGVNTGTTKGAGLTVGNNDPTAFISSGGDNTHLTLTTMGPNGAIRFYTQGGVSGVRATTESMRISPLGRVGIGTISPGEKLDVMGNIRFSGGFFIFNTQQSFINWGGSGAGDLTFRTLNTIGNTSSFNDKMIIKYDGNVGIGTTTPGEKLDVSGNIRLNGTHLIYNSQHGIIDWGGSGAGDLAFRTLNTTGNTSSFNDKMIIKYNGNVGIGTTAPQAKLEITGNLMLQNDLTFQTSSGIIGWGAGNLRFRKIGPRSDQYTDYAAIWNNGYFGIGNYADDNPPLAPLTVTPISTIAQTVPISLFQDLSGRQLKLFLNSQAATGDELAQNGDYTIRYETRQDVGNTGFTISPASSTAGVSGIRIASNGRVGIGHANPTAKLGVGISQASENAFSVYRKDLSRDVFRITGEGKVYATEVEVKLATAFPDYVFSSEYKLRSLYDVEQFIKVNKHLPEVPSASNVETNGMNIGEMQTILLKKIEELTLYVIELKKENDKLKEMISK